MTTTVGLTSMGIFLLQVGFEGQHGPVACPGQRYACRMGRFAIGPLGLPWRLSLTVGLRLLASQSPALGSPALGTPLDLPTLSFLLGAPCRIRQAPCRTLRAVCTRFGSHTPFASSAGHLRVGTWVEGWALSLTPRGCWCPERGLGLDPLPTFTARSPPPDKTGAKH